MTRDFKDIQFHFYEQKSGAIYVEGVIYVFIDGRQTRKEQIEELMYLVRYALNF